MRKKTERQRRRLLEEAFNREVLSGKKVLPEETSARLLVALHDKIEERASPGQPVIRMAVSRQPVIRMAWFRWSAAALLILLAGSWWWYHPSSPSAIAARAKSTPGMTRRANTSDRDLPLSLSDGSTVLLSPHSAIQYYPAFELNHRNIFLTGKAIFTVTADAGRPFTVFAGSVRTTALGTRFMVSNLDPGNIQVRLLEGKVVVQPSDSTLAMKDVYLLPGEQLVLDPHQGQVVVTDFKDSFAGTTVHLKKPPASFTGRIHIDTSILEFDQTPLPLVLTEVGRKYGVVFRLNGTGFNTILVTGKFLPSDSLSSVLSMLGTLNGLSFTENNDTIVVAVAHP